MLIDRPQSPQSFILAGQILAGRGHRGPAATCTAANEVLGGNFLSRINMELRETTRLVLRRRAAAPTLLEHQVPYIIQAPVQADRTGDSIAAAIGA